MPSNYAREKLPEMRRRAAGDLGQAVAQVAPRIWPGLPQPQAIATSANSMGRTEYITAAGFPEIGYYQVPQSTWDNQRCSAEVQAVLGRCANADFRDDVLGQVAIGLLDRRQDGVSIGGGSVGSQWTWAVGEMAYVMGGGNARTLVRQHAARISEVPEPQRFAALILAATPTATKNQARMMVRTWQRLKTGELLAQSLGEPTDWYQVTLSDAPDYELALSAKYAGVAGPATLDG